jgi:3alpha(or 20beta)-hydroxysteroid dehydrogenase
VVDEVHNPALGRNRLGKQRLVNLASTTLHPHPSYFRPLSFTANEHQQNYNTKAADHHYTIVQKILDNCPKITLYLRMSHRRALALRCDRSRQIIQRRIFMTVFELHGRKALITGGARGLGAGMAEALARAGAAVAIADIREDLGTATANAIGKLGATARFVPLDVTDDASWEMAIRRTIDELGGLDIVVNDAGVEISELVIDLNPESIRRMLEVNILGTALGIKHAFRAMRPGGPAGHGGSVINVSSVAATIAFPGIAAYSATKSAVDRLTRVAAMESGKLGYGVRVNCIYPGLVPTEMGAQLAVDMATLGLFSSPEAAAGAVIDLTPLGRLGEVSDMADVVVFLASDASRFITGAGLPIDGGMGM